MTQIYRKPEPEPTVKEDAIVRSHPTVNLTLSHDKSKICYLVRGICIGVGMAIGFGGASVIIKAIGVFM